MMETNRSDILDEGIQLVPKSTGYNVLSNDDDCGRSLLANYPANADCETSHHVCAIKSEVVEPLPSGMGYR